MMGFRQISGFCLWLGTAVAVALPAHASTTIGDCSPIVRKPGGYFTVDEGCPLTLGVAQYKALLAPEDAGPGAPSALADVSEELSRKLGVSKPALRAFFDVMKHNKVGLDNLEDALPRIARRHLELLALLAPDVTDIQAISRLRDEAREAVSVGKYDLARTRLREAEAIGLRLGQETTPQGQRALLAAVATQEEQGQIALVAFNYPLAAKLFTDAARGLPTRYKVERAFLLDRAGNAYFDGGRYGRALDVYREAMELRLSTLDRDHPAIPVSYVNVGRALQATRDFAGAVDLFRQTLKFDEWVLGPEHPQVAIDHGIIGAALRASGDLAGAHEYYNWALAVHEKAFGAIDRRVARDVRNIGRILQAEGDLDEALTQYRRALEIYRKVYGGNHPEVAAAYNKIGNILQADGHHEEALEHFRRALAIDEKVYGEDHPRVAVDLNNIGFLLRAKGEHDKALDRFRRALAIDENAYGPSHPKVAIRLNNIGSALESRHDYDLALDYFQRALAIDRAAFGPDHPKVAIRLNNIGSVLQSKDEKDEALKNFRHARDILLAELGPGHAHTRLVRKNIEEITFGGTKTRARAEMETADTDDETAARRPDVPMAGN